MSKTLYICYFGLREALVQTQVLPYLREIGKDGTEVSLLTFEPQCESVDLAEFAEMRSQLSDEGISWSWLPYHKRLSAIATAWDIFRGVLFTRRFIAREKPDILHGRVHVPTLMAALARKLSRHKPKLLFDIRGFFPEEYTDAGVWPEGGWLYRAAKRVEKWLLKESDGFVVLTERAREILFPESKANGVDRLGRPVEVIPCCVDLKRFASADDETRTAMRNKLGVQDRRVIAYVGSFGGWYLTDEMLDFFATAREYDKNSFAMILTQRDQEKITESLRTAGFSENDFFVGSVAPDDLPQYLAAADTALSFIKACYSKQSSSPTKIAEYLTSGLPIVTNRGVGDIDRLIEDNKVGVILKDFSPASYREALALVEGLNGIGEACRQLAAAEFDLESVGGKRYRRMYQRLLGSRK